MLADDGLIFISVDDNEAYNLRKVCDEIFGAKNYVNQFAWVSNITGRQIAGFGAAKTWESIMVYAKNAVLTSGLTVDIRFAKENMPDAYKGFNMFFYDFVCTVCEYALHINRSERQIL